MQYHFNRRNVVRALRMMGVLLALLCVWLVTVQVSRHRASQATLTEETQLSGQQPPIDIDAAKKKRSSGRRDTPSESDRAESVAESVAEQRAKQQRLRMVERQLRGRDITDRRVLDAMSRVPRHRFVPEAVIDDAYTDRPLPIGQGQTISQPYIVALMTQLARTRPNARALDVGTGSGYQAAVLAELVERVYSIEIVRSLADSARARLKSLEYDNIQVRFGDGYGGWPEHAPFDVIIVAAAPDHIPQPLIEQLAPGGRLVIPVGTYSQNLMVVEKQPDGSIRKRSVAPVRFVPMTGELGHRKNSR